MDAFTLLLLLLGFGSGATPSEAVDPGRGGKPIGG
jgi:hypothetical protein